LYKQKIWSFYILYYASCFETNQQFYLSFFQKYYHGESIAINVLVDNNTSKTVKKVKLSGKITFFWWLFTHV